MLGTTVSNACNRRRTEHFDLVLQQCDLHLWGIRLSSATQPVFVISKHRTAVCLSLASALLDRKLHPGGAPLCDAVTAKLTAAAEADAEAATGI